MTEATAQPKATLNSLSADLINNNAQGGFSLRDGGSISFHLTGVDGSKAKEAVKQALRDAAETL